MSIKNAPFLIKVTAAGVTIIPLFVVPILMKVSTGMLGRIGAWVNNPNRGPIDRARKAASGYRENRQQYRKLKALTGAKNVFGGKSTLPGRGIMVRRGAQREAVLNNRKNELNRASSGYIAGLAQDNDKFRARLAQGGTEGADQRALAQAINVQANLRADEVKAARAIIKEANIDGDIDKLQKLIEGKEVSYTDRTGVARTLSAPRDSSLRTAAIEQQFANGDIGKTDELVSMSGAKDATGKDVMNVEQRQAIADGMRSLSGKVRYYGGDAGAKVAAGQIKSETDLNRMVADSVNGGKWSGEVAATADKDALTRTANVIADTANMTSDKDAAGNIIPGTGVTMDMSATGAVAKLKADIAAIATSPTIKKPDSRTQARLDAIVAGTTYP